VGRDSLCAIVHIFSGERRSDGRVEVLCARTRGEGHECSSDGLVCHVAGRGWLQLWAAAGNAITLHNGNRRRAETRSAA